MKTFQLSFPPPLRCCILNTRFSFRLWAKERKGGKGHQKDYNATFPFLLLLWALLSLSAKKQVTAQRQVQNLCSVDQHLTGIAVENGERNPIPRPRWEEGAGKRGSPAGLTTMREGRVDGLTFPPSLERTWLQHKVEFWSSWRRRGGGGESAGGVILMAVVTPRLGREGGRGTFRFRALCPIFSAAWCCAA